MITPNLQRATQFRLPEPKKLFAIFQETAGCGKVSLCAQFKANNLQRDVGPLDASLVYVRTLAGREFRASKLQWDACSDVFPLTYRNDDISIMINGGTQMFATRDAAVVEISGACMDARRASALLKTAEAFYRTLPFAQMRMEVMNDEICLARILGLGPLSHVLDMSSATNKLTYQGDLLIDPVLPYLRSKFNLRPT